MTVIVADHTSMYADSQITDDDLITTGYKKVAKYGPIIVGGAGSYTSVLSFFQWVKEGMDYSEPPALDSDFAALVLLADGELYYMESNLHPMRIQESYAVIGSGGHYAAALMDNGYSPFDTVRAVCKRHTDCSEPIFGAWFDGSEEAEE